MCVEGNIGLRDEVEPATLVDISDGIRKLLIPVEGKCGRKAVRANRGVCMYIVVHKLHRRRYNKKKSPFHWQALSELESETHGDLWRVCGSHGRRRQDWPSAALPGLARPSRSQHLLRLSYKFWGKTRDGCGPNSIMRHSSRTTSLSLSS